MVTNVLDRTYYPGLFMARIINGIIGIVEFAFVLRLVLELLGASPASQFVAFVYQVTDRLLGPFAGAFSNISLGGFLIDVTAIFSMIGYAIIGWLLIRLLSFIFAAADPL